MKQVTFSQDITFGRNDLVIRLTSGKTIENARFWKLHDNLLEYEKEGSLHDVPIHSIFRIESEEAVYAIDSSNALYKLPDDLIILITNDTIRCLIREVKNSASRIIFYDRKEKYEGSVGLASVKQYYYEGTLTELSSSSKDVAKTEKEFVPAKAKKKGTFGKVLLAMLMFDLLIGMAVTSSGN